MFSSFQKDYINQHAERKSWKLGKWQACVFIVTLLTAVGLIAQTQVREPLSENILNLISFGSNLCVIQHMIAIPLLIIGMVFLGGANVMLTGIGAFAKYVIKEDGDDVEDAKDVELTVEASRMKMMRGSGLAMLLPPTFLSVVRKIVSYSLLIALIAGMALNGYNFSGIVVLTSFILSITLNLQQYRRVKNHVLTLNYDNVRDMEELLAKHEEKNTQNLIEVESS